MKNLQLSSALILMVMSFRTYAQETSETKSSSLETKVIAVVNRANWCGVCRAHGERFINIIKLYNTKGISIVMNDLTDESTIAKSKADLKQSSIYKQIYETNRSGIGRMLQACGILDGTNKSMASGIVTFIDAKTLSVLSETSIAISDSEMKTIIENLLKS